MILLRIDDYRLFCDTDNGILSHVVLKEVQDKIKEYLSFSVSIVVSAQGMLLTDISKLYTASYTLSFERFCLGHSCILFNDTILPYSDSQYVYPISKSNHLHEAILLHKPEIAKNLYLEIAHSLVGYKYSVFQENLLRTYFIISNALDQLTPTPNFFSFPIYLENLRTCETFEEVNALLMNIWNDFETYTLTNENLKYNEHIHAVYHLIEKNYTDFNLSSDTIADALGMSTGYVNKLFKKPIV